MRFTLIALLAFAAPAWAGTTVIFAKDGSKATVFMMAIKSNPDAIAFNNALALPAGDDSGKTTKKLQFKDSEGNPTLDIACAFSKITPDTGSCFVTFRPMGAVQIDSSAKRIYYQLTGADADRLRPAFIATPEPVIFQSSDGKLRVEQFTGNPAVLTLSYGQ